MVTPLQVQMVGGKGYLIIELGGELDVSTVAQVKDRFASSARALPDVLIVDLGAVTFLDSTALNLFMTMHDAVRGRDAGVFTLVNVDRWVGRPLTISGLDKLFRVHWAEDPPRSANHDHGPAVRPLHDMDPWRIVET